MRFRIVHIHSDFKFLNDIYRYECEYFENLMIIIGEKSDNNKKYHNTALFFSPTKKSLGKIIEICKDANLIVLNDLTQFGCKIVLALPQDIKIAWRFFGHELYGKKKKQFLSEKTKQIWQSGFSKFFLLFKKKVAILFKNAMAHQYYKKQDFGSAVQRIDLFFGLFEDEYLFLKTFWPDLPLFLRLSIGLNKVNSENTLHPKKPLIILGNSRNNFNNHADIIDIVESLPHPKDISFKLLFNYGVESPYAEEIRLRARKIPTIDIVSDFMSAEAFEDLYKNASALVLNAYRQMALGNILAAFRNGVKVYLNEKNITMQWLLKEGFFVFPITSLANDIERNNFKLTPAEIENNIAQLTKLMNSYTKEDFQNELYERVKNEKPKKLLTAE